LIRLISDPPSVGRERAAPLVEILCQQLNRLVIAFKRQYPEIVSSRRGVIQEETPITGPTGGHDICTGSPEQHLFLPGARRSFFIKRIRNAGGTGFGRENEPGSIRGPNYRPDNALAEGKARAHSPPKIDGPEIAGMDAVTVANRRARAIGR